MDRKRKAVEDEGTLKAQRPLLRQHRDRERRAWRVLRLAQYSKVHCHHWSSLGCRSPLQLLRKFMPCQTWDFLVEIIEL